MAEQARRLKRLRSLNRFLEDIEAEAQVLALEEEEEQRKEKEEE